MRKSAVPLLALLCFIFSATSSAKDLGVFGAVYDIAEKDALKEIEERAKEVDVNQDRQQKRSGEEGQELYTGRPEGHEACSRPGKRGRSSWT